MIHALQFLVFAQIFHNSRSRFYINIETKELVFCGSRDHATDMFAKFSCRRFWDVLVVLAIFVVSPPFYA
jgi:hypothetical protein